MRLTPEQIKHCKNIIRSFSTDPRFLQLKKIKQHHSSNRYLYSLRVARCALKIASKGPTKYDMDSLIRGALLHDYLTYDWREKDKVNHKHPLWRHPKEAYENAKRDYELTKLEKDIILHHMWPMTLFKMPRSKEAFLVCYADKIVTWTEASRGRKRSIKKRYRMQRGDERRQIKLERKHLKKLAKS